VRILALDLSTSRGSIALMEDSAITGELTSPDSVVHSTWLPGAVRDFLLSLDLSLKDMDILATTVGPGSFTGTRVGISTIKGLAWPLGKRVFGASTLRAMAYNIEKPGLVCPVIDARRGEVYAAVYRKDAGGALKTLMDETVLTQAALAQRLAGLDSGPVVCLGDGLKAEGAEPLLELENVQKADEADWPVRASVVARMAHEDPGGACSVELLTPVYLRKPGSVFKKSPKAK